MKNISTCTVKCLNSAVKNTQPYFMPNIQTNTLKFQYQKGVLSVDTFIFSSSIEWLSYRADKVSFEELVNSLPSNNILLSQSKISN